MLGQEIKKLEKKEFMCRADAEEEWLRFKGLSSARLFRCQYTVKEEIEEKWPRGRRKADAAPKRETRYRLEVDKVTVKGKESGEYLQKNSCIVLISNVTEKEAGDKELMQTYKGQQVVENSFREVKSPSMASVIYLKNPERIKALGMLLAFSLLVRADIQYRMREGLARIWKENPKEKLRAGERWKPYV